MEFSIPALPDPDPSTVPLGGTPVQTTGRFIVVFARGTDAKATLARTAGVGTVADSRDFTAQAVDFSQTEGSDAVWFDTLGVAVVTAEPAQLGALRTAEAGEDAIISVSPELIHHILDGDYLQGYRDGVSDRPGGSARSSGRRAPECPRPPPIPRSPTTPNSPGACRRPGCRPHPSPAPASRSPSWTPGSTWAIPTSSAVR
ncbi:MAG: hypothetical protein U0R72_14295 [Nakamurella multipartita]